MRKVYVAVCLAMVLAVPLVAQQKPELPSPPPSVEEVMKFFSVMHVRDQMQNMLEAEQKQIKIMQDNMLRKALPDATPEQKAQFTETMDASMNALFKDFPIDDLLRDMVPIYQKHLTEADLNAVINFYSSPVGQRLLREMPAMTQEGMRVSFARMQPKIDEMMKTMQERVQKMKSEAQAGSTKE